MSFQIKEIKTVIESHRLREDRIIVSAAGRHAESVYLTLSVADCDGHVGYGEAAITPIWSGETALGAKNLVDRFLVPLLIGATFDRPDEGIALIDRAIVGCPFAKSAVDTALWDLWAKRKGCCAWELFSDREPVRSLPSRASIGAYPVERTVGLARDLWECGVRTLKFKVGVPGIDDVSRLRATREELGEGAIFTVDYNGAFNEPDQAARHIEKLLPFNVALVEQPTNRHRISLMAKVRRLVDIPMMIDEGVFNKDQLLEALDLDAFDILSIYPGKNGGFTHSLEMAGVAAQAGKRCAIGSNLETDLGQAAMLALAAGSKAFPVSELHGDLMAPFYYADSSVMEPLRADGGHILLPVGRGFGVTPKCFEGDACHCGVEGGRGSESVVSIS